MAIEYELKVGEQVDSGFVNIMSACREDIIKRNDDRLFVCVGPTGSGKSMLGLHALSVYMPEATIDAVAGTRKDFAHRIKVIKDEWRKGNKGLAADFDEADTDNLEQNSKWNRAIFKLYMKIRFLNGFHWWNWPVLRTLDSRFVEERINGVFFCYTKEEHAPRSYAYFPKSAVLRLIEKNKRLSFQVLKSSIEKYAAFVGKFRDYNGKLKQEYLEKKHQAGFDAIDEFTESFTEEKKSEKSYNYKTLSDMLSIPVSEVKQHIEELGKQGLIDIGSTLRSGGLRKFNESVLKLIENRLIPKENGVHGDIIPFLNARIGKIPTTEDNKESL